MVMSHGYPGTSPRCGANRMTDRTLTSGGPLACGSAGASKLGGFRLDAGGRHSASPPLAPALGSSFGAAEGPDSTAGMTGLADVTCRPGSAGFGAPGAFAAPYRRGSGRSRRKQRRHHWPSAATTSRDWLPLRSTTTSRVLPHLQEPLRCHFPIVGTHAGPGGEIDDCKGPADNQEPPRKLSAVTRAPGA
jgi:hypothetical protein